MFRQMMVPVDLAHQETLQRALTCAAKLARDHDIPVAYVGVTGSGPSAQARGPEDFRSKLEAFAETQANAHDLQASTHVCVVNDLPIEVDDALMRAIDDTGADLVVMASHAPGWLEHFWRSNGGKLASHAKCSVMIVRS